MKSFLEVFPDLNMTNELQELLKLATVERVAMARDRSSIRIYLVSPRLIHKKNIYDLEKGIREQLFPGKQIRIKIHEKYRLSRQYTPEKLLLAYRDSIQLELKDYSIVEYAMMRKAECTFTKPDLLLMAVEDTMINKEKTGELKRVLEKIFGERCGFPIEVEFRFVPPVESRAARQKALQVKQETERMVAALRSVRPDLIGGYNGDAEVAATVGMAGMGEAAVPWEETHSGGDGAPGTLELIGQAGTLSGTAGQIGAVGQTEALGQAGALEQTGMLGQAGALEQTGMLGQAGALEQTGMLGQAGAQGQIGAVEQTGALGQTGAPRQIGALGQTGVLGQIGVMGQAGTPGRTGALGQPGATARVSVGGLADKSRPGFKKRERDNSWSNGYNKKSDNPDVLYGRDFEAEFTKIQDIEGEIGEVVIRGKILTKESRLLRSGKTLIIFNITDFTDTITVKVFVNEEQVSDLDQAIAVKSFILLKGVTTIDRFDGELTIGSIRGIKKGEDFTSKRMDHSPEKRVELHCHTKMSDMDGVSDTKDIINRAKSWGMSAIAITDHGCVQAFPEASHALGKDDPFKVIYGVEGYLVDDLKELVENPRGQKLGGSYVLFDIETTGFSPEHNKIIEIGAVKLCGGQVVDQFSSFVNPDAPIPFQIEQLTGINDNMVLGSPRIEEVLPRFLDFCQDSVLVAHNASFDVSFIRYNADLIRQGGGSVSEGAGEGGILADEASTLANRASTIRDGVSTLAGGASAIRDGTGTLKDGISTLTNGASTLKDGISTLSDGASALSDEASTLADQAHEGAAWIHREFQPTVVDTVGLARFLLPTLNRFKLDTVAKALNIPLENHHRAVDDARATAQIFLKFITMLKERGITDLDTLNAMSGMSADMVKKLPTYHIIILAKNEIGRVNLYRLVSYSHIDYYARRPRIPKSVLSQYREGLIIATACESGELFQALLRGATGAELAKLVNFYDYLEIQPIGNNAFMLRDEKSSVNSEAELMDLNRRIVKLGEQFGKLVCATCDVHFLNPEDEVYRRIIMAGKGFSDADQQAPLYLRTTQEMLDEFAYLGLEKAEEVVIANTRKVADMCEWISPVRPDKCPPVIENSDETLRKICYDKAHEKYGKELPGIVVERLERELNSIISNGFAVMYIISQKLVWKSNEDGYLVGSRGSVGSSFVATMSGITEVNPLSPHYYCSECYFHDFDSEAVRKFSGMAGCDMPDRVCPNCGAMLKKDGYDIPFETFLGFKGDKEPDIDLNFSGEYQSKAHDYTEVIFGKGQTFRAGTIGTLADKTAFGMVKKYYEERGIRKRNCEIDRTVQGCVGIRRTTGQHPGGIVVLPIGEEIYSFTPVQRPANDMTTKTVTTHFDYHSIDHNLLKLDILGHDDPTMIRMLQDLTGLDPVNEIPLDSREVMSLFQNTEALGIVPEDIGGCKLGALGIPEFGTDFAMQMLIDAQPKYFSDLVRIAGLAHGTDVWLGNAKDLILSGQATIQTAICCRDDIMVYLIAQGVEEGLSFNIMESVRKGKGLRPEWIEAMRARDVPQWYIDSCLKIKYMFPKAHAAAYVMMAWRVAYCKVFHPLAYYAAYFSIRANGFSYELMCQGRDKLEHYLADYRKRADTLSKKEQDTLRDMRIVQEMYARGFEFEPLDIYRAKAYHFQIVAGKLMPSLASIDGMGEKAAEGVVEAAREGGFLSREDFRNRAKVSKTLSDLMGDMGLLGNLPENNQLSLFDLM